MADSLTRGRQGTTRRRGESVAGGGGQLIQELMDLGHLVAVGRPVGTAGGLFGIAQVIAR